MTISGPDLSNNNGALTLEAGTAFVFAKCTEGNYFADGSYIHYLNEAHRIGALFAGYHFLRPSTSDSIASQVALLRKYDQGMPQFTDVEPAYGNGPTFQDALNFADLYRSEGGKLNEGYIPRWYWQQWGSPNMSELNSAGIYVISSSYTAYSDSGVGWASYGNVTPNIWQFTDSQPYAGSRVDFNAFKGTVQQLSSALGAAVPPSPKPPIVNPAPAPVGNTAQYRASHNTYTPLTADGVWGPKTTQALQFVLGVVVDGVYGPVTKRALQGLLAVKVDGVVGYWTIIALQRKVGATPDGVLGLQTVTDLQNALNQGRFF